MNRITTILSQFISERIPKKATNVFWQMFNGVEAMFVALEYRLDISKRERNILTAQHLTSLRNLAAQNGFEPKLKIPASGILQLKINPKLFQRAGYPLFIRPYSVFTNTLTKLNYFYISDKTLRIDNSSSIMIPVIEGEIKQQSEVSAGYLIERFYIPDANVAQGSITVEVNGNYFLEVKSFYDNEENNNNRQFLTKFSNNSQTPITIYIKGLKYQDNISIIYRLTSGELGNIEGVMNFETDSLIDSYGAQVTMDDTEISILNLTGFDLGSNGTDENSLRAAIGYNHGNILLFDNQSYTNFINQYSTVLLQKIRLSEQQKSINNIYLSKKQALNTLMSNEDIILQYQNIVNAKRYFLSDAEKSNISKHLDEVEFCMSSHNVFDSNIVNYAFQINFDNPNDIKDHKDKLSALLYMEFAKFMYIKYHLINLETIFEKYMTDNNIRFDYSVFNSLIEADKFNTKLFIETPYVITHDNYLPILKGNFNICDTTFNQLKLFFDINIVSK